VFLGSRRLLAPIVRNFYGGSISRFSPRGLQEPLPFGNLVACLSVFLLDFQISKFSFHHLSSNRNAIIMAASRLGIGSQ